MSKIILLIWMLCFSNLLSGQSSSIEHISVSEGLSQGMIYKIKQDQAGFLWIATKNGLNRYDGQRFWQVSTKDTHAVDLKNITITELLEDSKGRVWIGTEGEGLFYLEKNTGKTFKCNSKKGEAEVPSHILHLEEDLNGKIWMGASGGLFRINSVELSDNEKNLSTTTISISDIYKTDGLCISVRIFGEQIWWSDKERVFSAPLHNPNKYNELTAILLHNYTSSSSKLVTDIFKDKFGHFWISRAHSISWTNGKEVRHYHFNVPVTMPKMGFSFEQTSSFLISAFDLMRADYDKNGRLLLDTITSLSGYFCKEVYKDHSGVIWLGTNGYGILKYNPFRKNFRHAGEGMSIQHIQKDFKGRAFAWSQFFLWEIDTQNDRLIKSKDIPQKALASRNVLQTRDSSLWFHFPHLDRLPLLMRWNPRIKSLDSILYNAAPYYLSPIFEDNDNHIWMSSLDGKLLRIFPDSKKVQLFDIKSRIGTATNTLFIHFITQDNSKTFWLGTSAGLFSYRFDGNKIIGLKKYLLTTKNFRSTYVFLIHQDEKDEHILWLGTRGSGLIRFDKRTGQIRAYTQKNGLSNDVVYGILPYKQQLWMSTNRGISVFNKETERFVNFHKNEGLQDDEFNGFAFCKISDSLLIFGGINGLNLINPGQDYTNLHVPKTAIIEVLVNNIPILPSPIISGEKLGRNFTFSYDQNQIIVQFAALDFRASAQNSFQYLLEGAGRNWIPMGNQSQINLSNLQPGKYKLKVKGSNNSETWSEEAAVFSFTIRPPWWLSKLAKVIYILLIIAAAYMIYLYQIGRIKMNNELIYKEKEAQRLQELDRLKTIFFSNITHELKTPLTLILEPVRQVLNRLEESPERQKLLLAERNSNKLLLLVNQLLDLSKLDEGKMKVDVSEGDFTEWFIGLAADFKIWAEKKQIQFKVKIPETEVYILFDQQKLTLILSNLISNALKFSDNGTTITLSAEAKEKESEYEITIRLSDQGIGISSEEQQKIFNRFHQVENTTNLSGGGTGIGLALVKELTELLGGKIELQSELQKGTSFKLSYHFPKVKKLMDTDTDENLENDVIDNLNVKSDTELPQILIIEDNEELGSFIASTLSPYFSTLLAKNGTEGIEKAIENIPELIITDLMMPGKDGFEVCSFLKNEVLTSHIPIIMLTAKSTISSKIKGLQMGADDYISKPFLSEELLARIQNLLNTRRLIREKYSNVKEFSSSNEHWSNENISIQDQKFLKNLDDFLKENIDNEALSVDQIANHLFISRIQLYRKLKAITAASPSEYVRNFRLEYAFQLLKKGEGNVNEVCIQVGMNNRRYFTKSFKERFGILPSEI